MDLYRSFNFRSIGASHIKKGTVCQDFSGSVETDTYKLAVISDGHGGEDYFRSDRGSRFAVEAFCKCVEDAFAVSSLSDEEQSDGSFLQNKAKNFADALNACKTDKQIEEQMRWFMRSIVTRWNILVEDDLSADPFKEEEMAEVSEKAKARYEKGEKVQSAYGATLIGVVATDDFWFGVHIGDGKCVAFDMTGIDTEPIPWDEQCFLNVTTSICDANASSEMRYFFSRELPAAVFVGSDGIDDSFKNERHLHNFYRVVLSSFATETEEKALLGLADYLPNLSAQGSADDMSVGCIINIEHIKNNAVLYEKKKEPYLKIVRTGNLGAKTFSDDYSQKKEIEAVEGIVHLDMLGCYGFGKGVMQLEVKSVEDSSVTFAADGAEYTVTPDTLAEITKQEAGNGIAEYDRLIIQCFLK